MKRESFLSRGLPGFLSLCLLLLITGCAGRGAALQSESYCLPPLWGAWQDGDASEEEDDDKDEDSTLGTILLYLPNRFMDAGDMVRVGVNVGFGGGVDARITWWAQAAAIFDTSVGVGFQSFRHLPVCSRLAHVSLGAGPISTPNLGLLDWQLHPYDVRLELFVLIVGAHAAVDLEGIFDFVAGIFTWDPSEDDFVFLGD